MFLNLIPQNGQIHLNNSWAVQPMNRSGVWLYLAILWNQTLKINARG